MAHFNWNFERFISQGNFIVQSIWFFTLFIQITKEEEEKKEAEITFKLIYQKQCLTSDLKFNENHHVNSMILKMCVVASVACSKTF